MSTFSISRRTPSRSFADDLASVGIEVGPGGGSDFSPGMSERGATALTPEARALAERLVKQHNVDPDTAEALAAMGTHSARPGSSPYEALTLPNAGGVPNREVLRPLDSERKAAVA